MRSHGGVEIILEDKTLLFWKPTSFKSHETRKLSGRICSRTSVACPQEGCITTFRVRSSFSSHVTKA